MVWFTSKIDSYFSLALPPVLLHGRMVGDETGLWFAIAVLFVAIAAVGGSLLAFLIRTAQANNRTEVSLGPLPDDMAGPDSYGLQDR